MPNYKCGGRPEEDTSGFGKKENGGPTDRNVKLWVGHGLCWKKISLVLRILPLGWSGNFLNAQPHLWLFSMQPLRFQSHRIICCCLSMLCFQNLRWLYLRSAFYWGYLPAHFPFSPRQACPVYWSNGKLYTHLSHYISYCLWHSITNLKAKTIILIFLTPGTHTQWALNKNTLNGYNGKQSEIERDTQDTGIRGGNLSQGNATDQKQPKIKTNRDKTIS